MNEVITMPLIRQNMPKNGVGLDQKITASLDKLAQLPTEKHQIVDNQLLKKRARSKYYSQQIIHPLLYIDSELHKYYSHAYRCCETIIQSGKKLTSRYCNTRICNVCNRIRTAKMMNSYINPLKALGSLQFTTLTIPNVEVSEINEAVKLMLKTTSNIIRVIRERKRIDISGIRKIEITYNHQKNNLHPHIHLLHNNPEVGELFITEWLKRYPKAMRKAQDTRQADDKSLNETFKYTAKFLIKDDKEKNIVNVFVPILDKILFALSNKRTIQSFGKLKKVEINEDEILKDLEVQEIENISSSDKVWIWSEGEREIWDWLDQDKNRLTNYEKPDIQFIYYL
jgi:hypothetical protein